MNIYITCDGDSVGQLIGRARLADDISEVRRLSNAIDAGNKIISGWAQQVGGSTIENGGDEISIEVPADALEELPGIRERYRDAVGATVSVGVGMRLGESAKALLVAKLRGRDQVIFYTTEIEQEVRDAQKDQPNEKDKILSEYLKTEQPLNEDLGLHKAAPAMAPGPNAGFAGASRPTTAGPVKQQGDHEEGQVVLEGVQPPPEATHAGADFEQQLHDEASKGEQEDVQRAQQGAQGIDEVKQQVAQALVQLKSQAPLLEQVRQQAPKAYLAMQGLVAAVIAMTRQLPSQQDDLHKTEDGKLDMPAQWHEKVRGVLRGSPKGTCLGGECHHGAEALSHLLGGDQAGWRSYMVFQDNLPHWYLKHDSGRILDPTADHFDHMVPYGQGRQAPLMSRQPSPGAQRLLDEVLKSDVVQIHKAEHNEIDYMRDRDSKLVTEGDKLELVHIGPMGTIGGLVFWKVNGLMVRDDIDIDFVEGGNPGRYSYVPEGEIWIDDALGILDTYATCIHEFVELQAMKAGQEYEKAHDLANVDEKRFRAENQNPTELSFRDVEQYLDRSKIEKDELDKAKLPMPTAPAHHTVVLPVGSQEGVRVKTASGWRQMSAGKVRGLDGEPASSRNPGAGQQPVK